MARKTLLRMVQLIGAKIGADEIDELDETIEATEIVDIIEMTYDEVLDRRTWEFMKDRTMRMKTRDVGDLKLFNLPLPSSVVLLQTLRYRNTLGQIIELEYVSPMVFLDRLESRNAADANITEIANEDGVLLKIQTDTAPSYYTSFNERDMSFDAYDSTRGDGNIPGDTVIVVDIKPTMDFTDPAAFLPVPERMGSLILAEAMATAAFQLRQVQDGRSERIARRQGISLRDNEPSTNQQTQRKNHGRKTGSGR